MNNTTNVTSQAAVDQPIIKKKDIDKKDKKKKDDELDENFTYNTGYFFEVVKIIGECGSVELYPDGTVVSTIVGKDKFIDSMNNLSDLDVISEIDVDVVIDGDDTADMDVDEIDIDDVPDNSTFILYIYSSINDVVMEAKLITIDEYDYDNDKKYDESELYDDYEKLEEVKRKWKVNSKGVKRLKMKCKPGFVWNGRACVKISGSALAKKRMATKKTIRTKRAQGDKLKRRTQRLTKKAKRYRKSYGLK